MAEAVARGAAATRFKPSFHLWMALAMAAFVFAGFGMSYLMPMAQGTLPHAPPVVHMHGFFFFAWTILLVVQSALVNARNVKLHRSLGTFGIAVATLVVMAGAMITIVGASTADPENDPNFGLFYLSAVAPPSFAVIFAMAIRAVRTPAVHRNLILIAMLSILMPGINRFYMLGFGLGYVPYLATYLTMDAMLAATLFQERRATGGISRMTWIAAAIVVLPQLLFPFVAYSEWFADFIRFLGSLVYYR